MEKELTKHWSKIPRKNLNITIDIHDRKIGEAVSKYKPGSKTVEGLVERRKHTYARISFVPRNPETTRAFVFGPPGTGIKTKLLEMDVVKKPILFIVFEDTFHPDKYEHLNAKYKDIDFVIANDLKIFDNPEEPEDLEDEEKLPKKQDPTDTKYGTIAVSFANMGYLHVYIPHNENINIPHNENIKYFTTRNMKRILRAYPTQDHFVFSMAHGVKMNDFMDKNEFLFLSTGNKIHRCEDKKIQNKVDKIYSSEKILAYGNGSGKWHSGFRLQTISVEKLLETFRHKDYLITRNFLEKNNDDYAILEALWEKFPDSRSHCGRACLLQHVSVDKDAKIYIIDRENHYYFEHPVMLMSKCATTDQLVLVGKISAED